MIVKNKKCKFYSKRLKKKRALDDSGDGPIANNVNSTNSGIKTIYLAVTTYEKIKKEMSYYFPKREVECDGIHTKPLCESL